MKSVISRRSLLQIGLAGLVELGVGLPFDNAQSATASPILGCFVGNPNGSDPKEMATFEQNFDRFASALGSKPAFMNAFTDFHLNWDQWVSNAGWSAWSWSQRSEEHTSE